MACSCALRCEVVLLRIILLVRSWVPCSELKLKRGQISHLSAELLQFLTKKFEDKSVNLLFERCNFWQISWCIRFKAINYWRKRNLLILYFFVRMLKFWTKWKRALGVGINNCETSVLVKCINTLSCWMIKQLLNSISQNIVICQCLADQLFASAFGIGK